MNLRRRRLALLLAFLPAFAFLAGWGCRKSTRDKIRSTVAAPLEVVKKPTVLLPNRGQVDAFEPVTPPYRCETDDSWRLALQRYPPSVFIDNRAPVILVHGEGFNRYIFDWDEKHSLARYLAKAGFDTWIVELRGHGMSDDREAHPPKEVETEWIFEDYIIRDLQAAMDFIRKETGHDEVSLIGHSTGGVIVYGAIEKIRYSRHVRNAVVIAAPLLFTSVNDTMVTLYSYRHTVMDEDFVDLSKGTNVPAPFEKNTETVISLLFFNDAFLDKDLVEQFMEVGLSRVRTLILDQFAKWYEDMTAYATEDSSFLYYEDQTLIRMPLLILGGLRDNFAEPENVYEASLKVDPRIKTFQMFGKVEGHMDNYGHTGLLLGDFARKDVYPVISNWLVKQEDKLEAGELLER